MFKKGGEHKERYLGDVPDRAEWVGSRARHGFGAGIRIARVAFGTQCVCLEIAAGAFLASLLNGQHH